MKTVIKDIFLKQMLNFLKKYLIFTKIYDFCQKKKLEKVKKLVSGIEDKKNMLFT